MGTKRENRRFAAGKLLRQSKTANDLRSELVTLLCEYRPLLGIGDELESELVDIAKEEVLGVVPDGSDTLQDDLPSGVGAKKSLGWAVRFYGGESYGDIALAANTNTETVQQSVDVATDYIGLEGETGTD